MKYKPNIDIPILTSDRYLQYNACLRYADKLKIVKVIPLHKKDEKNKIENYRPISTSKCIKGVIRDQIYD